jgi:hypothetical protein
MTENGPQPPAAKLMELLFGFALSRSIAVAAQLGVADLLKDSPKSADELAAASGAHPRSLYRMLRGLAGAGIFAEDAAGRFSLTPLAEPLCSDAPESLRGFAAMIADAVNFETWSELHYTIQNGQPAFPHKFGMPWFTWLRQNPEESKAFNDAMTSMSAGAGAAVVSGYDFSGINRLVDVGGGHGLLLAAILSEYPKMKGVLYDAPSVVVAAQDVFAARGVADRCEIVGGDFFQAAPAGADAYIMKHIIHDWSDEECVRILSHCRAGMTPGGKILIVEMVIPERNVPGVSKLLDLQMMVSLTGCERTETEYRNLLDRAGFDLTRITPTPSPYSVIEGVQK